MENKGFDKEKFNKGLNRLALMALILGGIGILSLICGAVIGA